MFDRIAPTYDVLNHTLSANIDRLWRRRVVRIVRRTGAKRIMDMATGTGDLAVALAKHIDGSHILGVDLSERCSTWRARRYAVRDSTSASCCNRAMPSSSTTWPPGRSMR